MTSPIIIPVAADTNNRSLEADLFSSDQQALDQENISATGNLNIGVVLDYDAHAQRHGNGGARQEVAETEEMPELSKDPMVAHAEQNAGDSNQHYTGDNSNQVHTASYSQPGYSALAAPQQTKEHPEVTQSAQFNPTVAYTPPAQTDSTNNPPTTVINKDSGDGITVYNTVNNNNTYNIQNNYNFTQNNTQNNYINTTNNHGGDTDIDVSGGDIDINIDLLGGGGGDTIVTNITNNVSEVVNNLTETVENIVNNILGDNLLTTVVNTVGDVTGDLTDIVIDVAGDVTDILGDVVNNVTDIVGDVTNLVTDTTDILQEIIQTAETTLENVTIILDGLLPHDPLQPILELLDLNGNLIDVDLALLNNSLLATGEDGSLIDLDSSLLSDLSLDGNLNGLLDTVLTVNTSELPLLGDGGLGLPDLHFESPDSIDDALGDIIGALGEDNPVGIIETAVGAATDILDGATGAFDDALETLPVNPLGGLIDIDLGLMGDSMLDTGEDGSLIDIDADLLSAPADGLGGIIDSTVFVNSDELPVIGGITEDISLPDIVFETTSVTDSLDIPLPQELEGITSTDVSDAMALADSLMELAELAPIGGGGAGMPTLPLDMGGLTGGGDADAPAIALPPAVVPALPPVIGGFGGGLFGHH